MAKLSNPHAGSLQFWPRKRAKKFIPSVNWKNFVSCDKKGVLGFIAYKVGMTSTLVKDNTEQSMSKGKKIVVPATVLEVPAMKIF